MADPDATEAAEWVGQRSNAYTDWRFRSGAAGGQSDHRPTPTANGTSLILETQII